MTMLNKAFGPPFRLILLVYVNAQAKGRYLFETLPAARSSLAVKPKWNLMTNIAQFKVKPETTIIEDKAAPHGLGVPSGQTQKYINDLERSIRQ